MDNIIMSIHYVHQIYILYMIWKRKKHFVSEWISIVCMLVIVNRISTYTNMKHETLNYLQRIVAYVIHIQQYLSVITTYTNIKHGTLNYLRVFMVITYMYQLIDMNRYSTDIECFIQLHFLKKIKSTEPIYFV